MNEKLDVYYNDDYAGLETGKYNFYYGYEVLVSDDDENSEWCFQVKENEKIIFKLSTSEIDNMYKDSNKSYEPNEYLLAGIGIWLLNR